MVRFYGPVSEDGSFDDATVDDAVYTPSAHDISTGQ